MCTRKMGSVMVVESPKITKLKSKTDLIAELVKVLKSIDAESPSASLNETTISDNNGGRIEL